MLDENYNVSQEMRGRMDAAIASGFYEHGAFGSPQDIEAQINRLDSPGYDVKSFLDASGHIIPYDTMDDDQRSTFGDWMRSDRVQDVVHESLQSAGNGVDARVRQ